MYQNDQQKISLIERQLCQGRRNPTDHIDINELKEILDLKHQEKNFPEDLYSQLINQLEKNNKPLTIRSFAQIWLEADQRLEENIVKYEQFIDESKTMKDQLLDNKREAEKHEVRNANNVMQDSVLTINFINAQNLVNANNQPINAYFVLSCEGQQYETEISNNPNFFEINKNFTFQIKIGEEPLFIKMIDSSKNDDLAFEGIYQVLLQQDLQYQTLTEYPEVRMYNENQEELITTLTFEAQWLYSRVKMAADQIDNLNKEILQQEEDLKNALIYQKDLYSPFPELLANKKFSEYGNQEKVLKTVYNPETDVPKEGMFDKVPMATNATVSKFLLYAVYVYVIIALLTSFDRCVFLDMLMSLLLFSSFQINIPQYIRSFATKILGGIILQTIFDIFWFMIYFKPWWSTGYDDSFSLLWVRRLILILSFVLLLIRTLVMIAIIMSYRSLESGKDEFQQNTGGSNFAGQQYYFDPTRILDDQNRNYPGFNQ